MHDFVRLLLAHLISDIFLNRFAAWKRTGLRTHRLAVLTLHTGIVFAVTVVFFADRLSPAVWFACGAVAGSHFLIDALRLVLEGRRFGDANARPIYSKRENLARLVRFLRNLDAFWRQEDYRSWFLLNVLDQGLHLSALMIAAVYLRHAS